jgi:5-methylcytosine-specific restriction endonuclease McrA
MARRNRKPPMTSDGKGATCAYCRRTLQSSTAYSALAATRDHVIPKVRGGTYKVWCCFACNNLKEDKSPAQWTKFMADNPEWWKQFTTHNGPPRVSPACLRNGR